MTSLAVQETSQTSLAEMNVLAQEIARLRDREKAAAEIKSEISQALEAKENRVLEILMENSLTNYKAPDGTMSLSFRLSAKLPQGEERTKFYEYLKASGKFDDMVSVNSNTFNSYIKEQYELAQEQGESEPKIPGVSTEDIKTLPRLSFRRSR